MARLLGALPRCSAFVGAGLALLAACGTTAVAPPPASFLVVAGDSTFWLESRAPGITARRSALLLTRVDGRFHELYVADEDLSYRDALMIGQRIFRRDLRTGDSVLVWYDSAIAGIARAWAAQHPGDRPLGENDEANDDPVVQATTDTELLDVEGPYLSYEFHLDIDAHGQRDQHVTRRAVVDIRNGHAIRPHDLLPAASAQRVLTEGRARLSAALDSVRQASDERATQARTAIGGFAFDSTSFALMSGEHGPALAFLVPGRGATAGGYSLPLGEIPVEGGAWWSASAPTRPTRSDDHSAVWSGPQGSYDVVATVDAAGAAATIQLQHDTHRWTMATVPLPVRRVFRLGSAPADSAERRALVRAFDEADTYGGLTRPTALRRSVAARRHLPRLMPTWTPKLRATARRSLPTL